MIFYPEIKHSNLGKFIELIRNTTGFNINDDRRLTLQTSVESRIDELNIKGATMTERLDIYYEKAISDRHELVKLISGVTINESFMFREAIHFNIMVEQIIPTLLNLKTNFDQISILIAGCSRGEESVSTAIYLAENYPDYFPERFRIDSIDIDPEVLEIAKNGVYQRQSLRAIDSNLEHKYTCKTEHGFQVDPEILKSIKYRQLNLKNRYELQQLGSYDIIFYRNVSIYFHQETQLEILESLNSILNDGGYLITGISEVFSHNTGLMELIENNSIFYFRKLPADFFIEANNNLNTAESRPVIGSTDKADRNKQLNPAIPRKTEPAETQTPISDREKFDFLFNEAARLLKRKQYSESILLARRSLTFNRHFEEPYLLISYALMQQQKFTESQEVCQELLAHERWSIEGRLLLAMTSKALNDSMHHEKYLRQAIYLNSSFWLPHFLLAIHLKSNNLMELARREYQITERLIDNFKDYNHYLRYFPLSFNPDDVRKLCELESLKLKA